MYLAWFDADRKKPVTEKIAEARERYLAKFGAEPAVCLVNPADAVPGTPVELRPAAYISRNCFWIGVDEQEAPRAAPPEEPAILAAPPAVPAAATEIGQREDPAPTRKRQQSPKPAQLAQPLSGPVTEPSGPVTRPARSTPRIAARKGQAQEVQVAAATPVAPTALAPRSRKRATAATRPATTPAVPTRDDGKATPTAPAAGRAARRASVIAPTTVVDTRVTGRKPAPTAEPTAPAVPAASQSSKGKRQPAPSVIDSKKVATPAKAAARDKAPNPAAKNQPARTAKAPKSTPAKPRKLAEAAKDSATTRVANAKSPATTRPRRERPAA